MSEQMIRLGVAGLGRAFTMMLPAFVGDARVRMVACADPRLEARKQFETEFGGRSYETVEAMCADPEVDAVYLSTPHQFHAEHVDVAARNGKHVLVEKPMAITLAECEAMIESAHRAGIVLIIGHSHSFDLPVLRTRELIASGAHGALKMITALNFTDFIVRPRRPEELDTRMGGGVVFSQGAHQIDVARLLAGGRVKSVRAQTGAWDPTRPTEGAYSALLTFESGVFATLTYNGYGRYDSDELTGWIGELGMAKDPSQYGIARKKLETREASIDETTMKVQRGYGNVKIDHTPAVGHNHFGMLIASCERADLRPMPTAVMIYGDAKAWPEPVPPPVVQRVEVIDELVDAINGKRPAIHNGEWSMATLEVCLAILESSRTGRDVMLRHQVGLATDANATTTGVQTHLPHQSPASEAMATPSEPSMTIRLDDLAGPEIRELLEEHLRNMHEISPPESVHALDLEKLRKPEITFWTAWSGTELLGCGALKELDRDHGEIKSMRTASAHRRQGVAHAMLKHIVEEAQRRSYHRLSLETGSQEDFEPAQKLYQRFGFTFCPPFGDYKVDPNSVFMTKVLEAR